MTILLTGATGFLGRHLAKALVVEGFRVVALKRATSKNLNPDLEWADYDPEKIDSLFVEYGPIATVIHMATNYGRDTPFDLFQANLSFPMSLLCSAERNGVARFLNIDTILPEDFNLYAFSKRQFLNWAKWVKGRVALLNVRMENFYGYDPGSLSFFMQAIESIVLNRPFFPLTEGLQKRDFIHIDDAVSGLLSILRGATSDCEFSLGSGHAITVRSFMETIAALTHSTTHLQFGAIPLRPNEILFSQANIDSLKALGWSPRYSLREGLKQVISQFGQRL